MRNIYIKCLPYFFIFTFCILIGSINAKNVDIPKNQDYNTLEYLDIDKAFALALANNPNIKATISRLEQAEQKILQSKSNYWPSLDLEGLVKTDRNPGAKKFDDSIYELGLKTSWLLFDGFENKFRKDATHYGREIALTAVDDASRLLLSEVSSAFYKAQLSLENIKITKANEIFNERLFVEADTRYNLGVGSLSNVLECKIGLNKARIARRMGENNYKIAMNNLFFLIGISDSNIASCGITLSDFSSKIYEESIVPDIDILIQTALKHYPGLKMKSLLIKQNDAIIRANIANKCPRLSVSALANAKKVGDMKFSNGDVSFVLSAKFSYNFFDGGFRTARVREMKERENELKNEEQKYLNFVKTEIKNAVIEIFDAQARVRSQRKNTCLLKEIRDLLEKEYFAKCNSLIKLSEAQNNLVVAQSKLAKEIAELNQAWIKLELLTKEQVCKTVLKVNNSKSIHRLNNFPLKKQLR